MVSIARATVYRRNMNRRTDAEKRKREGAEERKVTLIPYMEGLGERREKPFMMMYS